MPAISEAMLKGLGFDVKILEDASRADMVGGLAWLREEAEDADDAVFFYSGHGMELNRRNFLIPRTIPNSPTLTT